jgi:methylmalonyl-CoA/ethylmalonyl-CoA epimerase
MANGIMKDMVQICVVVKDLDKAMQRYSSVFGIKDFVVYKVDTDNVPGITDRGQPTKSYAVQVGMARLAGAIIELLEPLRGETMYQDFLDQHGEGVHHVGLVVDDYDEALKGLTGQGFGVTVDGPIVGESRKGRFTYFDTQEELGTTFELLDFPEELLAKWR